MTHLGRLVVVAGAVALGGLVGAVATESLRTEAVPVASPTAVGQATPPVVRAVSTATPAAPSTSTLVPPASTTPVPPSPLLVWAADVVPPELASGLDGIEGVEASTVIRRGIVDLVATTDAAGVPVTTTAPGWAIPFEVLAVDPDGYGPFLDTADAALLATLDDDGVLLGETSARLRGIGVGGTVVVGADRRSLRVQGVLSDAGIGGAEALVTVSGGEGLGVQSIRYALVNFVGERRPIEVAARALEPEKVLRVRGPGETPFLRAGDAVLAPVLVKEEFGEFSLRVDAAGAVEVDPEWVAANIVTAELPILGTVQCHRAIIDALEGALDELEAAGLVGSLSPDPYRGCFVPGLIRSTGVPSRHTWGIAIDLAAWPDAFGAQDPRVVDVFERWGFTNGGDWLIADPVHFEALGSD